MDGEQALKRLSWLVKNRGNRDQVEAFNYLVKYVRAQNKHVAESHLPFAKIYVATFLHYARTKEMTAGECVAAIDALLANRLEDMVETFRAEIPHFKFMRKTAFPIPDEIKEQGPGAVVKFKQARMKELQGELIECLNTEYSREDAERFLNEQINRAIYLYGGKYQFIGD